jgi:hypothetical protein
MAGYLPPRPRATDRVNSNKAQAAASRRQASRGSGGRSNRRTRDRLTLKNENVKGGAHSKKDEKGFCDGYNGKGSAGETGGETGSGT